jgi:hypothetical protein
LPPEAHWAEHSMYRRERCRFERVDAGGIDLTRVTPIQSRDIRRWGPARLKKKKYRYQRLFDCSMIASELNSPKETAFHSYRLKRRPERTSRSSRPHLPIDWTILDWTFASSCEDFMIERLFAHLRKCSFDNHRMVGNRKLSGLDIVAGWIRKQ